jgi:hypothetical protein
MIRSGPTPWPVATTACGTFSLVLLVSVLPPAPVVLPFVARIAELALAGGAAYLVDDAAASLTTVAPRGTWRRRAPVLVQGTALLACAWVAVLLVLGWREVRPPVVAASGELVVLGLVAVAVSTVLARNGEPEPGGRVAPALVLSGITLLIAGSVLGHPILLPWDETPGTTLVLAWAGTGLLASTVALGASRDPAARVSAAARRPRQRSAR